MQATSYWTDNFSSIPSEIDLNPSRPPAAENAQQDPHIPWFYTGVTAPFLAQSTTTLDSETGFPAEKW